MLRIIFLVAILQILLTLSESAEQCGKLYEAQLYNQEMHLGQDEYPWIGIVREKEMSKILCIAVLITRRHTIFPAHCVTNKIYMITFVNNRGVEIAYEIEEVAIHPDFVILKDSDIAIGKLSREVSQGQPICMPPTMEPQVFGQRLELTGITFDNPILRIKGHAHIATPEYCLKALENINHISSHHICGYLSNSFLSGSALMGVNVTQGNPTTMNFFLTGLLVFGKRSDDRAKATSVFLRINLYKDWILRNTME